MSATLAAQVFTTLMFIVVLFQLALALGAPWGSIAMGGRYPGKFPPPMRIAAVVQAFILAVFAFVVVVRGQMIASNFYDLSTIAIWVVVVLMASSLVMQLITPSKWERIIWAPTVAVLFLTSLIVALS